MQFNDNSQLKVHRLVLSACTDYFNLLEQTCEIIEDILVMPNDLQADVIVPIVNFMYTGTLEFQYNMFEKLFKTARDMNMTVLTKLLEAHRQTTSTMFKNQQYPVVLNKNANAPNRKTFANSPQSPNRGYGTRAQPNKIIFKHHQTTIKPVSKNIPEPIQIVTRFSQQSQESKRPSRFIVSEETIPDPESSYENISYESKPLLTASQIKNEEENSPFETLRKGYTYKRLATGSAATSPPSKKPNLDDVKELSEAQRLRSQIADEDEEEEEDDDADYDGDTNFAEEEFEEATEPEKGQKATVISKSTKQITVKDDGGNVNHAKIISEVLKKYPHLVKNNKNIKLKIMSRPSGSKPNTTALVQAIKQEKGAAKIVTSTPTLGKKDVALALNAAPKKIDAKTMHALIAKGAENMTGPWLCLRCGINGRPISIPSYKGFRKHLINVHKEQIDSRICEHCGFRASRKMEMITHQFGEHQIKPPHDVKLYACSFNSCKFVTERTDLLEKHKRETHSQQCMYCNKIFSKEFLLYAHMRAIHREKAKQDGVIDFSDDEDEEYVPSEKYVPNMDMGSKIKILSNVSITPKSLPFTLDGNVQLEPSSEAEGLNNLSSGIATSLGLVDQTPIVEEYDDLSTSYLEDQLAHVHGEYVSKEDDKEGMITKLVTADGSELQLTDQQREQIMHQLQSQGNLGENMVVVLNQSNYESSVVNTDDPNVVVYDEFLTSGMAQGQEVTTSEETESTSKNESESVRRLTTADLENAEIVFQSNESAEEEKQDKVDGKQLISELENDWDEEEEVPPQDAKTEETDVDEASQSSEAEKVADKDPSKKLKNLLDDWSEDEIVTEQEIKESELEYSSQDTTFDEEKSKTGDESVKEEDTGAPELLESDVKKESITVVEEVKTEDDEESQENGQEVVKVEKETNDDCVEEKKAALGIEEVAKPSKKSSEINTLIEEWDDDL